LQFECLWLRVSPPPFALAGFGWQATDVDGRRVSPEAPQERREAGAHVAPFAFLMRPFGIELVNEGIEAVLLLQAVEARRPGSFLFESPGSFLFEIRCRRSWRQES
jgi:hypothetical protein